MNDTIDKQLSDMENMIAGDAEVEEIVEEPVVDLEPEPTPDPEPTPEPEPEVELTVEEEAEAEIEPEVEKEPEPEPELDALGKLEKEMVGLRAEIIELRKPTDIPKVEPVPETVPVPEPEPTPEPEEVEEQDFIGDLDLDEVTRDPAEFNKVLNKVLLKGIDIGEGRRKQSNETIIRSVPDIVKKNIEIVTNLKRMSDKFYEDNPDLKPWQKAVASVFEEKIAENPDKTYEEIMGDVGTVTRERLKLNKEAIVKEKETTSPKLPGNKGNKRSTNKPKTDSLAGELDAMDAALES